jgi:hypothetical protein
MDLCVTLVRRAAIAVSSAAIACRAWENGGDPDPVSQTAFAADEATLVALEAAAGIETGFTMDCYPETRLARLLLGVRLLVLAGTDEGGTSEELDVALVLLKIAEQAGLVTVLRRSPNSLCHFRFERQRADATQI